MTDKTKKIKCLVSRCLSCGTCAFVCAVEHSVGKSVKKALKEKPVPVNRRNIQRTSIKDKVKKRMLALSSACHHCENPVCVEACMSGALYKDTDGAVKQNADKCVGCWMCIMVCPFGAVSRRGNIAVKCDLCSGREKGPACVEACPTKALVLE